MGDEARGQELWRLGIGKDAKGSKVKEKKVRKDNKLGGDWKSRHSC